MGKLKLLAAFVVIQMCLPSLLKAQATTSDTVSSPAGHHRLWLTTSGSQVRSEEEMIYTVHFSLDQHSVTLPNRESITLHFPTNAAVITIGSLPMYGNTPGGFVPIFSQSPGEVTMRFDTSLHPTPTPISGDFTVHIKIPANVACKNDSLSAYASMVYFYPEGGIRTSNVFTRLVIDNPWTIQKKCISAVHVGGTGTCRWATASTVLQYEVEISLQHDRSIGAQNIEMFNMTDLPSVAGCGFGTLNLLTPALFPAGFTLSGAGVFTSPVTPFVLDAVNRRVYRLTFQMTLPGGVTSGTCIANSVRFLGIDSCYNADTLYSDTSHVEKRNALPQDLQVYKQSLLHGNTRGCEGTYTILVHGPAPDGYRLFDTLPACLTNIGVDQVPDNGSATAHPVGSHNYWLNGRDPLVDYDDVDTFVFHYTIGDSCAGCITNRVYDTNHVQVAAVTNCLLPDTIQPCIDKSLCHNDSIIGGKIRFRLRIQNYGTIPMTHWKFVDNLKAVGLDYLPNTESYYYAVARNFITSCGDSAVIPTNGIAWPSAGTNISHTYTGGVLTYTFNTVNRGCDSNSLYENNIGSCNGGGNLAAWYIEFDARITDSAGIGVSLNKVKLYDSLNHYWGIDSVPFTIKGNINITLNKTVSTNGGATYDNTGTTYAGSLIRYKLQINTTGVSLYRPYLVDFLPMNKGIDDDVPTYLNDRFLLQPGSRGSQFNVFYHDTVYSSHQIPLRGFDDNNDLSAIPDLGNTAITGTNPPGWVPVFTINQTQNLKVDFKQNAIAASNPLTYIFSAKVWDSAEVGQQACNTFAATGFKKVMTNYKPDWELQLPVESRPVCIGIAETPIPDTCCSPDSFAIPRSVCYNVETQFCVLDQCSGSCPHTDTGRLYIWQWGDGSPADTGKCVSHAYSSEDEVGSRDIVVSWLQCGVEKSDTFNVHIGTCDECDVVAQFYDTVRGHTVVVDASPTTSSQPVAYYLWDFGDGTVGTGLHATHNYVYCHDYDVKLTVYTINSTGKPCACYDDEQHTVSITEGCMADRKIPVPKTVGANNKKVNQQNNRLIMTAVPNPFNNSLTVTLKGQQKEGKGNASLLLIDPNGRTVLSKKFTGAAVQLDTTPYPSGVYLLMYQGTDGTSKTTRVVKIK